MSDGKQQYIYVMQATDRSKAASRETWTPEDHETFDLHWANLERLKDAGQLILAGRMQDGSGMAICILEVDSDDEARQIFEAEPFIQRGFATGSLHPYRVALSRNPL